jgi:D-proline reductase (dithiol) PrdB
MPRADGSWTPAFRARYAEWWPQAEPLIRDHKYQDAFKTYPFPRFATSPWAPLAKPLREAIVALVTTGAVYRRGSDKPFKADDPEGDLSFRRIPRHVELGSLDVLHPHIPQEVPREDMNIIFPLGRLEDLRREGIVGRVADTHYSILGYNTRAADVAEHVAPALAALMKAEGVDLALLVPV